MKSDSRLIKLLLRIGLVARKSNGRISWPVRVAPAWIWRAWLKHPINMTRVSGGPVYLFRNLPGVIKWKKGRLLPRRWGIGFFGLIEFGDRGH